MLRDKLLHDVENRNYNKTLCWKGWDMSMKTVKDYLVDLNKDELVDEYFRRSSKRLADYYFDYIYDDEAERNENLSEMSVIGYAEMMKQRISEFIDYLKSLEIADSEDGEQGIVYAYKSIMENDNRGEVCTELLYREELLEDPVNCHNYGYSLSGFPCVLGFLVADNKYTQTNIYGVIADVLHEATWYGYRQEDIDEEINSLNEESEKMDRGEGKTYNSADEMFTDILGEDLYREMKDREYKETDESKALLDAANKACREYDKCSMMRERMILLESLK